MKKSALTASTLRIILLVGLLGLLTMAGLGFYRAQKLLTGYAREISELNAQAAMSEQNLDALRNIEQYLADHAEARKRAASIVADSQQYRYQNEIINDLSAIARNSGISITSYTFSEGPAGAVGAPPTGTPPPTTGTTPTTQPAVSSLKSKTVNIAVASPVDYVNLLNFINRIEQNTTKMQVASVALSRAEDGGASMVTTEAFDIEVYVR